MSRAGEVELWTATRGDGRGAFARGRKIGSSTGGPLALAASISPRGRWIITQNPITTSEGAHIQLGLEPFAGGDRRIVEPAPINFQSFAFSPTDDSLMVADGVGPGRLALSAYPLPSGAPVQRGTFDGASRSLEWLSDGWLALWEADRVVRVFGPQGEAKDLRITDSLGAAIGATRSPSGRELGLVSQAVMGDRVETMVSRLNPADSRFTLVARTSGVTFSEGPWWTADGWLHFAAAGPGDAEPRLYRVPIQGGAFEAEPPIGFESHASVVSLSQDGRRAIVRVQSKSTDLWVLRAEPPK